MGEKNSAFQGGEKFGGSKQKCTHSSVRKKLINPKLVNIIIPFLPPTKNMEESLASHSFFPTIPYETCKIIEQNFINLKLYTERYIKLTQKGEAKSKCYD